jgi:hypothetical protein
MIARWNQSLSRSPNSNRLLSTHIAPLDSARTDTTFGTENVGLFGKPAGLRRQAATRAMRR